VLKYGCYKIVTFAVVAVSMVRVSHDLRQFQWFYIVIDSFI